MGKPKKTAKRAKRALSAKLATLVASAANVGFAVSGAFESAVGLCQDIRRALPRGAIPSRHPALIDAGLAFKAGYVARRLSLHSLYAKRWGNYSEAQMIEEAGLIYARPYPESSKPNRRTDVEHKACRAADTSWTTAKARAGIVSERKGKGGSRKPRPGSNKSQPKAPPVSLTKASPKLATREAANDFFATAAAALLATVNKNAKNIAPQLSSAVTDFKKAIDAFLKA